MQEYVDRLLGQLDGQTRIADRMFPSPSNAMILFTKQVLDSCLLDYSTYLIGRTRQGSEAEVYLKTVVGTYHQCCRLVQYLNKPKDATRDFRQTLFAHIDMSFTPQIDPYLRVELDHYRRCCDSVVDSWKKKVRLFRILNTNVEIADEANDFESETRGTAIRENDKTNFL